MIAHGGNLEWANRFFGEPADGWLDLSTGISPWCYPAPKVPEEVWQRLPGENNALKAAASEYYQVDPAHLLPLPGSQFGIAHLPRLVSPARVALPMIGYAEHRRAWLEAGHQVIEYRDIEHLFQLVERGELEHIVLLNPNNPSTEGISTERLQALYERHNQRGLLVVDEAFADLSSGPGSVSLMVHCPDLWVLRSVGKFFGLAGLRLGFLIGRDGHYPIAERMQAEVEPWGVSHPAQWLGAIALRDGYWQAQQRVRVCAASRQLGVLWRSYFERQAGLAQTGYSVDNAGLFVTLRADWHRLHSLYLSLGRRGILLRWCHWPEALGQGKGWDQDRGHDRNQHKGPAGGKLRPWLRCGLPADGGARLAQALDSITVNVTASE